MICNNLSKFCPDDIANCLKVKANFLLTAYEKLIFKLGLMDCSFLVFNNQITCSTILSLQQINQQLITLETDFLNKIKKFNEVEQKYLTNNLN